MAVPDWHIDLPQELLVDGYGESPADITIESNMDIGPAKVRRRFTAGVRPVSGYILLTSAQLATFKTFYNDTILGGSLRFNWTEPPAHTTSCEMRFTDTPNWTKVGDYFKIAMNLEILP
jgi:hypothetical protein